MLPVKGLLLSIDFQKDGEGLPLTATACRRFSLPLLAGTPRNAPTFVFKMSGLVRS
jgi:hypothetical protein